jgi:cytoplasmic iron level regulating protein YaaA (DUF328/UPF0246 family)
MPNPSVVILLPPSEGKAEGGVGKSKWSASSGSFGKPLGALRTEVITALAALQGGGKALLGVQGALLARAQHANTHLVGAPTLPAWQRYTGVVWDHLDLASLSTAQRTRALSSIVVVSGLHGLVAAGDPIPDYRLKMGARLSPMGTLSKWWSEPLTAALLAYAGKATIIDLLPNEHRAALDWSRIPQALRVDLVTKSGGKPGGHNAKAAKGLLARHILSTGSTSAKAREALSTFRHPQFSAKVAS